ncbi:MarR family winged helix-turn-helix transcriptional regulator [Rubellimicrobium aerolatum]|uniref:MarR family winged helix-turn-helix transcriptional regulator n=1 Tax=Rubellimicrobium aerolatum TaxID=490979 RepID=A0ABW0SH60_9RHOB|nr:MarR family transcriptional regulator [Rubellimicrobium aerolatum]MBP1807744.1 MarR family transcriptional regulator for hemolysin [Rubellimicrobium aerolatum]
MHDAPPGDLFGFRLSVLARQWRRAVERHLARAGLTDASWAPLIHLHEAGDGIAQKELAARVGTDDSSLVRLLDILEGRALIERRIDDRDRRARLIHLTPAGREEVARLRRLLAQAEADLLADVSDAEVATMLAAFDRIAARLRGTEP